MTMLPFIPTGIPEGTSGVGIMMRWVVPQFRVSSLLLTKYTSARSPVSLRRCSAALISVRKGMIWVSIS